MITENSKIENPYENRFYLGFNKDTGELVDVVGPDKTVVSFHPQHFKRLNEIDLDPDEKIEIKEALNTLRKAIRDSSIPSIKLVFFDDPSKSVCGGSCGGIPFRIC